MNPTSYRPYRTPSSFSREDAPTLEIDTQRIDIPTEFVFDVDNPNWTNNDDHNQFFITRYVNLFNDKLAAHGRVFLNEVLDALGIKQIIAGQLAGWTSGNSIKIAVFETVYRDKKLHHYNLTIVPQGIIIMDLDAK